MSGRSLQLVVFCLLFLIVIVPVSFYLFSQSLRLDEAQTIWVAAKPMASILKLIGEDVHVPLYFTFIHFWVQLFGTDVVVVRIPSFIFYILTIMALYKLASEYSTKNVAFLAIVLFSLSPFVVWYSVEARMYTMFTFIASLNSLYFLRFLKSNGQENKFPYFITTVFGFYTHYFFLFLTLSQMFYLLIRTGYQLSKTDYFKKGLIFKSILQYKKLPLVFLRMFSLAVVFLMPWIYYVYSLGRASNSSPLIPPPDSFNFIQTFAFFIFGFQSPLTQGIIVAFWPLSVGLLFLVFTRQKIIRAENLDYFAFVTFIPIILVFIASLIRPIFLARYLIFTVPTFFLLLSFMLLNNPKRVARTLSAIFVILTLGFLVYQSISLKTPVKENYKEVSEYLNKNTLVSDIVVVSAPFTVYPIEYYYNGNSKIETVPVWDRFSQGTIPNFSLTDFDNQVKNYKQSYGRVFVVLSYDQGYESGIKDYLDHNYQRQTLIEYSPGLELRVYKLRYDI